MKKLNILIIGGTGFIGRTLSKVLLDAGYRIAVLSRRPPLDSSLKHDIAFIQADITMPGGWQELIPEFDVLVNLAGVSIFRRWTSRGKQEILNSRIIAASNIIDALRMRRGKMQQLFSVSGVGYYGFHGDEILDEDNPAGSDFLARVAARWEEEVEQVKELGIKLVILRWGMSLVFTEVYCLNCWLSASYILRAIGAAVSSGFPGFMKMIWPGVFSFF